MKKVISIILTLLMMFTLFGCSGKETMPEVLKQWQEQYDLGNRYMLDGNYDEAIIAFQAAIKIDDKNVDAWLGLADAYIGKGDYDSAKSTIIDALSFIEDQRLADKLNEIEKLINSSVTSETTVTTELEKRKPPMVELLMEGMTENVVRFEDMQPFGHAIGVMTLNEWQSILSAYGVGYLRQEKSGSDTFLMGTSDRIGNVLLAQAESDSHASMIQFDASYPADIPVGTKDINDDDSLGEVFAKLGFSNSDKIEEYLISLAVKTAETDDFKINELITTQDNDLDNLYEKMTGKTDLHINIFPEFYTLSEGENLMRQFQLKIESDNPNDSSAPSYTLILVFRYDDEKGNFNLDYASYHIHVPHN